MGKGTIGINPFHTDRSLMSPVAVAGLLATVVAFTDSKGCKLIAFTLFVAHAQPHVVIVNVYSYPGSISLDALLYCHGHVPRKLLLRDGCNRTKLTTSSTPQRFLITFDEDGNLLPVTVRVGQVSRVRSFQLARSGTERKGECRR